MALLCIECGSEAIKGDLHEYSYFVYRKDKEDYESIRYIRESISAITCDYVRRHGHVWTAWLRAQGERIAKELDADLKDLSCGKSDKYGEWQSLLNEARRSMRGKRLEGFDDVLRLAQLPSNLEAFIGRRVPHDAKSHEWTCVSHEEMAAFDLPIHPDRKDVMDFMKVVQDRLEAAGIKLEFKEIENQLDLQRTFRSPWFSLALGMNKGEPIKACVGRRNNCWAIRISCLNLFDYGELQRMAETDEALFIYSMNDITSTRVSIQKFNAEIRLWEQEDYYTDEKAAKMADYILCATKLAG